MLFTGYSKMSNRYNGRTYINVYMSFQLPKTETTKGTTYTGKVASEYYLTGKYGKEYEKALDAMLGKEVELMRNGQGKLMYPQLKNNILTQQK